MKKLITNYTFDASAKTITLLDYASIYPIKEGIILITNVTDNIIMYNFANSQYTATLSKNVITLSYDTTLMDDTDDIQIFYDDASNEVDVYDVGANKLLIRILEQVTLPSWAASGGTTLSTTVATHAISTVSTVSTVTTVTALTNFGGSPGSETVDNISGIKWAASIRGYLI